MGAALQLHDLGVEGVSRERKDLRAHDARKVAEFFVARTASERLSGNSAARVNALALQKLVYIANALHLVEFGSPLVTENPKVGEFDPYFPSLHDAFAVFGGQSIGVSVGDAKIEGGQQVGSVRVCEAAFFSRIQASLLELVFEFYKSVDFDCPRLTVLTGGNDAGLQYLIEKSKGIGNDIPLNVIRDVTASWLYS